MLKRIAVVGETDRLSKTLSKAARERGGEAVHVRPGDVLPPGSVAVVTSVKGAQSALDAAIAIGDRLEETLNLLAEAIDCREAFTPGNALRVKQHATRFAEALGLDADAQLALERGALVRDIGKLKIPNEVLLKEGLLTYDEWETLHQHTNIGADLVRGIDAFRDVEDVVRTHHECYDGTGYPGGLERDAIPYLGRVMKIIDVYCAMTSARRYREGTSSHDQAIAHVHAEKGKHFDPDLAQVFLDAQVGRGEDDA